MSREEEILDGLYEHTLNGDDEPVLQLTQEGLELGMKPLTMVFDALIPALEEVGRLFEIGDYFVPEMLIAAQAMQGAMNILKPLIAQTGYQPIGTFVMGTVKGDIHDIGKNLVAMMMEGAGFEVINIGINNPVDKFIDAIKEHNVDILGMSALLTTTMPYMRVVIDALKEQGLREKVIVLVGGAPLNEAFAEDIDADAYCRDAAVAVETAKKFMRMRREG